MGTNASNQPPSKPKSDMNFGELDALMADLTTAKPKPAEVVVEAPVVVHHQTAPAGGGDQVDDLLADLQSFKPAPPSPRPVSVAEEKPARSTIDDLLSDLHSALPAGKVQTVSKPVASGKTINDLDRVMDEFSEYKSSNASSIPSKVVSGTGTGRPDPGPAPANSKGLCAMCNTYITGEVSTVIGKLWHPEHFQCLQCQKQLGTHTFFEKEGMPYCEKCFHDMYSNRCAYCNGPILDRCINALNKMWHPDHFFCSQCGKSFDGCGFMEKDGKAYCEEDYYNMFAPKCGGCEKPIMSECISALGFGWHPNCFVCFECHKSFDAGAFYEHEGKPFCEVHFHQQKGSLCASCQKPILGRCVTALSKKFHPEHFACAFCAKQLLNGAFKEKGGKPYCPGCHVKLFG